MQEIEEETDTNQNRQNIKQALLEAATEFKPSKDVKNYIRWWEDECKRTVQEKKEAKKKFNKKNKNKFGYPSTKKIKANRICIRKKKEWIERKIKELNEKKRKSDTRNILKDIRNLSNLTNVTTLVCKDKDGYILLENTNITKMATIN